MNTLKIAAAAVLIAGIAPVSLSYAAGDHDDGHSAGGHGHGASADIGTPGGTPSRTISVVMYDNYYEPENISVAHGETVKFVVKNAGEFVHEFNINTPAEHVAHAPMMEMMFEMGMIEADKINRAAMQASKGSGHDMSHDEANSVLMEPGETREVVWTFNTNSDLQFACNIPGHDDSGMAGEFAIAH